ncbi:MAG TPA: DegT/DnrJ/EryC1/StrS aminotransferase family protein [Bryobacteraceae bacterium]|nr:DegT/DnrJ/EryC1/StrS aminotransferase family protein [Bryobacteraceae bacterium]
MRSTFLPYCLPWIGEEEINEVVQCLRQGWLTTGPKVARFEEAFAQYVGAPHAIAVHSCTGALEIALAANGIGPGDEVIVPTLTFCSTANVVAHLGARPVIVDVDEHYQISLDAIERAITPRTRAIVPVHYAGQACDLDEILNLARRRGIVVIEDAAHAAGSEYKGRKIGVHGRAVCFSFYATKNMTTGEGGMITTEDGDLAARMRRLALHGMSRDAWKRYTKAGSWYYEVVEPGFKFNMTDIQASLGIHQLRRLDGFIAARQRMAARFREAFEDMPELALPRERPFRNHAYHLFPVRLIEGRSPLGRDAFIEELKRSNIGTSVHFIPLHRHPAYRDGYGLRPESFPIAERLYRGLVSLPLYPKMSDDDIEDVIAAVRSTLGREVREHAEAVLG